MEILGIEEADSYQEKNPDQRAQRERVPVSYLFRNKLFVNPFLQS